MKTSPSPALWCACYPDWRGPRGQRWTSGPGHTGACGLVHKKPGSPAPVSTIGPSAVSSGKRNVLYETMKFRVLWKRKGLGLTILLPSSKIVWRKQSTIYTYSLNIWHWTFKKYWLKFQKFPWKLNNLAHYFSEAYSLIYQQYDATPILITNFKIIPRKTKCVSEVIKLKACWPLNIWIKWASDFRAWCVDTAKVKYYNHR